MNLTLDNWISILAIILSMIVAFLTAYFTVKNNLNNEKNKGKIILVELLKRYFASCWNSWNMQTGKLNTDNLTKQQYLRVVERIEQDLLGLQNNLYYSSLLEKYPSITMVQIQLSREIAEQKENANFSLNAGTAERFYELYELVRNDLTKKYKQNKSYIETNNFIDNYIEEIRKNKA